MLRAFTLYLVLFCIAAGCRPPKKSNELFSYGEETGKVSHRLEEASGLVASIGNPGFLWCVNDSGNPPEVFLLDDHAEIQMTCKLPDIRNRDWEDIAIGPGPVPGKNYLYVADIGDNLAQYDYKYIYRIEEPLLTGGKEQIISNFDTLTIQMPDGKRDTEALLIDPSTHDLFIISKREKQVGLYRAAYPFGNDTLVLEKVETLPFEKIVAGSISPDGSEVLLKDYKKIYYWKRAEGETLPGLLLRKPIELPYKPEVQGEAITWANGGASFYTLSESAEGHRASLMLYKRKR